jgi:hypothetical protein
MPTLIAAALIGWLIAGGVAAAVIGRAMRLADALDRCPCCWGDE